MTNSKSDNTKPNSGNTKSGTTRIQAQNRQIIIGAALQVFSDYGYRGSTVAQIAAAANMSKANLLYYFESKQDVYLSVLECTLTEWLHPLTQMNPEGEPAEEIWTYVQAKLAMSKSNPEASRLYANEILQGAPMIGHFLQNDLRELLDDRCAIIQQWIDEGRLKSVSPLHLMFFIWATTQHYADFSAQTAFLTDNTDTLFVDAESTLKTLLFNGLMI